MKRIVLIPCLYTLLLLSGCTDIRQRKYADILTIRSQGTAAPTVTLRCDNEDTWISAEPPTALLFQSALEAGGGIRFSTGHLSLLVLQGEPLPPLRTLLEDGRIAPNCPILLCAPDCDIQAEAEQGLCERLRASVENGLLPEIGIGEVIGNLEGKTGITLLPYYDKSGFSLALHDENALCAVLSADACRGAALLTNRYSDFECAVGTGTQTESIFLDSCRIRIGLSLSSEQHLSIRTDIRLSTKSGDPNLAKDAVVRMLKAFYSETLSRFGADVWLFEEAARRDGIFIPDRATWQGLLREAVCTFSVK